MIPKGKCSWKKYFLLSQSSRQWWHDTTWRVSRHGLTSGLVLFSADSLASIWTESCPDVMKPLTSPLKWQSDNEKPSWQQRAVAALSQPAFTPTWSSLSLNWIPLFKSLKRVRLKVGQAMGFCFVYVNCWLGYWAIPVKKKKNHVRFSLSWLVYLQIKTRFPCSRPSSILWLEPVILWYFKAAHTWPSLPPSDLSNTL